MRLFQYHGKIVLLDFWATWCGGCKTEIPWYIEFDRKYRDQGLAVVGITIDDAASKVTPFVHQRGIDYTIALGNDKIASSYGVAAMPVTLLIDREGRIAYSHAGVVNKDEFEAAIRELLTRR